MRLEAIHRRLLSGAVLLVSIFLGTSAAASVLNVRVVSSDGEPVPGVAVYVEQAGVPVELPDPPPVAVMDQINKRFVPHVLVVQKGTFVEFPNSDPVAHHVYSFSRPNDFALPLYKGDAPDPVRFDEEGIAVLGCNIHDNMLGYIVVVGTDIFDITGDNGAVDLIVDEAAEEHVVRIWSPQIRDKQSSLVRRVVPQTEQYVEFLLKKKLRSHHHDHKEAIEWTDY